MTLCINPSCPRPENSHQTLFCQTCGSELLLDGKYRVQSELGCGGFGKTYEVISSAQESSQVLKILINPMEKALELFQREAEVLGQLNHPGIPHVDSDGYFVYFPRNAKEPLHCLIMEKIEGLNLQEYMTQRGNRPVNQKLVLKWFIEIVEILEIVHSQNFFHRDIKPSNVMLRTDGRLALIDFGTAREVTGTYVAKQEARGVTGIISAGYTPVEQLNGQAVQQSDFYALGRTISYLLTAREPSDIYDAVTDEFPWQQFAPKVHGDFADFLDQMMARIPKYRPPDTQSILLSLRRLEQFIRTQDPVVHSAQGTTGAAAPNSTPGSSPISTPTPPSSPPFQGASPPISTPPVPPLGLTGSSAPIPPVPSPSYDSLYKSATVQYANFFPRAIAFFLDLCILGITTFAISFVIGLITQASYDEGLGYATGIALGYLMFFVHPIMTWLYFSILHSSEREATFGKQVMGIRVVTDQGKRLSFGKATVRFMCRLLSSIIVIGHFLALFVEENQTLHDIMAETRVVVR